jgi:predicted nucleic acid-binding protein
MKVLVDTSVWSLALRRKKQDEESSAKVNKLADFILSSLVVMIGPIRQELLSGISTEETFLKLKTKLDPFDDLAIQTPDYETGAQFYNTCRKHGIQGSHIDFLICAMAHNHNLLIFTTDLDFEKYAQYIPVKLI